MRDVSRGTFVIQLAMFEPPDTRSAELNAARVLRDRMIEVAVSHADQVTEGWSRNAYLFLVKFAQAHWEFIAHDVVFDFNGAGYSGPVNPKAWGGVFKRAASLGIIKQNGHSQAPHRHLSPCVRWRSQIHRGAA